MHSAELSRSLRAAYVRLTEQRFGLRLTGTAIGQLDAVVLQSLAASSYSNPSQLFDAFAAGRLPRLFEVLATRLTSGETYFFSVTPQIEALRQVVLPDLIARHATDRRLCVWSAGCSTGEEPYTLAMLIREQLPTPRSWDIHLVASDINRAAIEVARLGVYGERSFRAPPSDIQTRYLARSDTRWQVSDLVRRMVQFATLNLVSDPPPFPSDVEAVDLIVCRGVTMDFHELAAQRLYQRFARALTPSGWLILGPFDPPPMAGLGFEQVLLEGALLWRSRPAVTTLDTRQQRASRPPIVPIPIRRASPGQTRVKRPRDPGARP
jgi:chemotaxis protein methyltransferase CheR